MDLSIYLMYYSAAGIYFSFRWGPFVHSLEIVQWDSTRRDHPGRVSGSGPVTGCIDDIDGVALAGNTNSSLGAQSCWYCPFPSSLLARRDELLTTSLKAGRCEVLLRDLALVFFVGERPKGGELPKDNLSFAGASALV